jgi:hypothetical protein
MGPVQGAEHDEAAKPEFYTSRAANLSGELLRVMVGWKATVDLPDKHGLRALKGATLEPRFL